MARVVHFEVTDPDERATLLAAFPGHDVACDPRAATIETADAARDADVVTCFVHSRLDAAALAKLERVKHVATRSTGFDHVDLVACRARAISVSNVPRYGENTVAEHAFALILALARRLPAATLRVLAGDFSAKGLTGFDLKGKTLGVVGAGSIGLHVVRIARGFGMEVVAHDAHEHALIAEVLGFRYVSLDELLRISDIVSLHVPAIPATHHLIDRARIATMKKGALLVNTARGSVVDTRALIEALDAGQLGGAGLDVVEGEEHLVEDAELLAARPEQRAALKEAAMRLALLRRPDVLFTPHVGFDSREARARIVSTTIDNVRGFLAGTPRNVVS